MKISYLINARMPTEHAHGIQVAAMCAALAAAGAEVELVVPQRYNSIFENLFDYYGIPHAFTVTSIPTRGGRPGSPLGYYLRRIVFAFRAVAHIRKTRPDAVITRDEVLAALCARVVPTVYELHRIPERFQNIFGYFVRRTTLVISTNEWKRQELIRKYRVEESRVFIAPNGFDPSVFAHATHYSKERFGIPSTATVVLYAGHLFGWKGAHVFAESMRYLPHDVHAVIVGGLANDIETFRASYPDPRIHMLGMQPHNDISSFLAGADVLVLPNVPTTRESVFETSPIKLFEYLASGTPVVASDLPSIREIAPENCVTYVQPSDAHALARGILSVLKNGAEAAIRARRGQEHVQQFSWLERARRILSLLEVWVPNRKPVRVLAVYRGRMTENRGTPIRVRSLLERLARDDRFSLTLASWDEQLPFPATHIRLSNNHLHDIFVLMRYIRCAHIDLVIGHTMSSWYYLAAVKFFTRVKIMLEMHGFIEVEARFYGGRSLARYTLERMVYRHFYSWCDLITTCSDNAAEILRRWNSTTVPIYGGVDLELFRPDLPHGDFFSRAPKDIVIGYAGNIRKWQGVPFLLSAFAKLHAKHPEYRLVMLSSETRELPAIEGLTRVQGVNHEDVPAFLSSCDILVIPRIEDMVSRISFPSKLPEYLAMGKPVVASATSDAHRVITDGVDGLLFPPGDTDAFICALVHLSDAKLRHAIGMAARATAERNFSWDSRVAILTKHLLAAM